MCSCYIVDQLHDKNCFSYTCTTEKTDLTTLCIRTDQVNNLDSCLQNLCCRHLFFIRRSLTMDRPAFLCLRCRKIVYRVTQKVKYSSQAFLTYRNGNWTACIQSFGTAHQTVSRIHGNTSYHIITNLLCNLGNQLCAIIINLYGIEKRRQFIVRKADIQYRTDNLHYLANVFFTHVYNLLSVGNYIKDLLHLQQSP